MWCLICYTGLTRRCPGWKQQRCFRDPISATCYRIVRLPDSFNAIFLQDSTRITLTLQGKLQIGISRPVVYNSMTMENGTAQRNSEKPGTDRAQQEEAEHDIGWWHKVLDLLLPACCVLCGMSSDSGGICHPCIVDLPWMGLHCDQCALPVASAQDKVCGQCLQNPPPFTRTVCPLQYRFPADRLVQSFKFNRQLVAGRVLSRLMCERVLRDESHYPDVLIPVPLHRLRTIKRGFNQAYEIGRHISKVLDIPLQPVSLRRRRNTKAQSGLSRKQRRKNVRGAFYWHGWNRAARHVALVDDVMTTGTTVTECARVLKRAGAKRVDVWVASRAMPGNRQ